MHKVVWKNKACTRKLVGETLINSLYGLKREMFNGEQYVIYLDPILVLKTHYCGEFYLFKYTDIDFDKPVAVLRAGGIIYPGEYDTESYVVTIGHGRFTENTINYTYHGTVDGFDYKDMMNIVGTMQKGHEEFIKHFKKKQK